MTTPTEPQASSRARPVVLFACGHPDRGDDAIAAEAVARLGSDVRDLATVNLAAALQPEDLVGVPDGAATVIVDAVAGLESGHIMDIDLADLGAVSGRVSMSSTHQLPLDRLVALAGVVRGHPLEGRFIGVGIGNVSPGGELSAGVGARVHDLTQAIAGAVRELARPA